MDKITHSVGSNIYFEDRLKKSSRLEFKLRTDTYFQNISVVVACTPTEIEKCFGEHNFTLEGEWRVKVWMVDYKNKCFAIISANNRGTTLESPDYEEYKENSKADLDILAEFALVLSTELLSKNPHLKIFHNKH